MSITYPIRDLTIDVGGKHFDFPGPGTMTVMLDEIARTAVRKWLNETLFGNQPRSDRTDHRRLRRRMRQLYGKTAAKDL